MFRRLTLQIINLVYVYIINIYTHTHSFSGSFHYRLLRDIEYHSLLWPPHAKSWLIGKRLWCWEGLGAGGEGYDRGWEGWMASLTRWTWVWVNSGSWCWTGRPGVLRFMGSQRVGHDWATDLIWSVLYDRSLLVIYFIYGNVSNDVI